ncbi:MAG: Pyrroline-5-carboxylate reductase [Devosia sp.]|nr:Pyrroline-5-carboxylate reductase [Devosia sp.]
MRMGFIGTGTISHATITGLLNKRPDLTIHASRRSENFSRALAGRFSQVSLFDDNVALSDASDIVVLAVRPAQLEDALAGISFRADQIVLSFVSGLTLEELQVLAPQSTVMRMVPLPMIARCEGPILAYPEVPVVSALFSNLGELIVTDSEAAMLALSPPSAFMSSFFTLQNALIAGAIERGAPEEGAVRYIQSLLASLSKTALLTSAEGRHELPVNHETPGGLNYRVRQGLESREWFEHAQAELAQLGSLSRSQMQKNQT